jgi:tyrosinase
MPTTSMRVRRVKVSKKGIPVPPWQRTAENRRAMQRAAELAKGAKTFRPPKLDVPKEHLLLETTTVTNERLMKPFPWFCETVCRPGTQYRVRRNQKDLSETDWKIFLCALETLRATDAPSPNYEDFVQIHQQAMETDAGMMWGAHTMAWMGHDGRNFLAWHREYLAKLEARLIVVNPLVTIPYWNSVVDRSIPAPLSGAAFLNTWGITRSAWAPQWLATLAVYNATMGTGVTPPDFLAFQLALETQVHNGTHNAVGGTMGSSRSPADPVFWLHHSFIDKCWADWQAAHPGAAFDPPNPTEVLQPYPIQTRKVSEVLSTQSLGYVYA